MRDEWIASRVLYLSALCPWRYTQGVFRFAPSFAKALCSSSLKGDIPCEVFLRLPQWSIYVETPNIRYGNDILVGFWAHLQNEDISMERPALKLLLNLVKDNGEGFLSSFAMLLEATSLEAFLKQRYEGWLTNPLRPEDEAAMHIKSVDHLALYRSEEVREAFYTHNVKLMRPILAMLLYLCTTEPDIVSNRKPGLKPANNEGRHVKKGFRLFPAEGPHIWNVGSPWKTTWQSTTALSMTNPRAFRAARSVKSARTSAPRIGMGTGRGVGPRPRKRICANSSSIGFRPCSCAAQEMSNPSSVPPKLKVSHV